MRVIRDGILLCDDCLIVAVNGDYSGLDYHYGTGMHAGRKVGPTAEERKAEIDAGLERLGPNLVPDHDSETGKGVHEHSSWPCGCCGTKLHGQRHEFAILGE